MASNQRIQKVCQHEPCSKIFIAQKVTTKFCSLTCARRDYKLLERKKKLKIAEIETTTQLQKIRQGILGKDEKQESDETAILPALVNIDTLGKFTTLSVRTIYRMMKDDPQFPKHKIRSNLRFDKDEVLAYLKNKYGSL